MTDNTNLDLLRRLDPLDMSTTAELDPDGATARRVRAAAIATAQRPGLTTHGAATLPRPRRRAPRIALAGVGAAALAAVALAVGLPGGGDDSSTAPGPADARAALVTAAERTSAFTSGHVVWQMAYVYPRFDMDMVLTNDFRFEGSDVDIVWTSRFRGGSPPPGGGRAVQTGGTRVVGGQVFERFGDRPYKRKRARGMADDAPAGVLVRVQAADALAAVARTAAAVQQTAVDGGTRFTAKVRSADLPKGFRPPFKRVSKKVAITAIVGDNGAVRSLALRAPGEKVDVTFSGLGEPQHIVVPQHVRTP
jgi:hypothetical protein